MNGNTNPCPAGIAAVGKLHQVSAAISAISGLMAKVSENGDSLTPQELDQVSELLEVVAAQAKAAA